MGLNGSGKTTFAKKLAYALNCPHLNADEIRKQANDWDFSEKGRKRQCLRMKEMAEALEGFVVCDFICPTEELRQLFEPALLIWINTVKHSKYSDTNKMFESPERFHIQIRTKDHKLFDLAVKQIKSLVTADLSTILKNESKKIKRIF